MATLTPCMDQYPNWPTCLSCIQISFLYVDTMVVLKVFILCLLTLEIHCFEIIYSSTVNIHAGVQSMRHASNAPNTDDVPPELGYIAVLGRSWCF